MGELIRRFGRQPGVMMELFGASLFANILALAPPLFVIQVLNRYVAFGVNGTLITLTIGVVFAAVLEFAFRHVRTRLADHLGQFSDDHFSQSAFNILARAKLGALMQVAPGMRRQVIESEDILRNAYSPSNIGTILDVPFSLVFLGVIYALSPALAVVSLVILGVVVFIALVGVRVMNSKTRKILNEYSQRSAQVDFLTSSFDTVRAFNAFPFLRKIWGERARARQAVFSDVAIQRGVTQSMTQGLGVFMTVAIIAYGATLVVSQDLTVGALIGVNILSARALSLVSRFAQMGEQIAQAKTVMELTRQFGQLPLEAEQGTTLKEYSGAIEFKDVGYKYPGEKNPLFESLFMRIKPGSILAITGNNGAGKSTLSKLLVGLLEPSRGHVLADNVSLRQLRPDWWRQQIQYLPQEPFFFPGTLKENILVNAPDLTTKRLNQIIQAAGLQQYISESELGFDAPIIEGGRNLALGLRRRLALARALASGGQLVVFDEPTEGLDSNGCLSVCQVLNTLADNGHTIIIASNDTNMIRAAEFLLDLNQTPKPVIVKNPHYAGPPSKATGDGHHAGVSIDLPRAVAAKNRAPTLREQAPLPPLKKRVGFQTHAFLALSIVAFSLIGLWSWNGKMDIVSLATGEVIPSSRVKAVQHLEGGIVSEILVHEGDQIETGQALVKLDKTQITSELEEVKIRIDSLNIDIIRFTAAAKKGESPIFSADLKASRPVLIAQALTLFKARQNRFNAQMGSQKELITRHQQTAKGIGARITSTRKNLKLIKEQIAISKDLLAEKITSRYEHISLLREQTSLNSHLTEDTENLRGARAGIEEVRGGMQQIEARFQEEVRNDLDNARREMKEFSQRLKRLQDKLNRMALRSPVSGTVKSINISTVGGVIKPGETVLEIVPGDDRLVIESALPTQDIGYVKMGQSVTIKLNSSDLVRFGHIKGTVVNISPDTLISPNGMPYYKVRIETERSYFEKGDLRYKLFPGMQVTAAILIGKRRIIDYLRDPFVNSFNSAFKER